MEYLICITSYKRIEKLERLIYQIRQQSNCSIIVFDDFSQDENYFFIEKKHENIKVIHNEVNNGKKKYWKTINLILNEVKKYNFKDLIFLDDDMEISKNFFLKIEEIKKNNKENIFINLFQFMPKHKNWGFDDWVDGNFLSPKKFWEEINWSLEKIDSSRFKNDIISSGVGEQISRKINNLKYKVFIPNFSLLKHNGNKDSKMNSTIREKNPLNTYRFLDDIAVSL